MLQEGIVKTICPGCFKIFDASDKLEIITCNFCGHQYELPKLKSRLEVKIIEEVG